ncbi:DUF5675 family protein [Pseudodesulfovibrio indicus]|uniref:DUF5675 domain-containing protein n=1 Tax=Pseudodesulfovibrio indicus TaxID=1716143 RepID=A0A126QLJ5_9BACT|nr:DUF5675 family protein [Pseudodesulfovibrio indicus]AMK10285.1 hypothetical protein AWY79_03710 [Pseudodesulfovibrio indicus]TDT82010.1 hypothetical protein EDC59_11829 [Pseudodesulfovibrio indicus]
MEKVDIVRLEKGEEGTFGVLRVGGRVVCVTMEPPDRGNRPDVSCIPAGRYGCERVESPAFGSTFEITGVPGRSHILFHAGNVAGDTRGCVLLGSRFGRLGRDRAVLDSRAALGEFLALCGDAPSFEFEITE